ncbi:alpha-L-fucosidase [Phocaeicola vulgatus]|nr:alpha-L-fucosidase [Phocaeicola vulgatus]
MKKTFLISLLVLAMISCKKVEAPQPFGPIPTEAQMQWQEMEMYAFIHFSINTFTDIEWGYGDRDPKLFSPVELDCRQWAKVCKEAGFKGIILTAKHHDGFCLWPSKYTEYSVKNSPWRHGEGDLVKELSEACKDYGLKFGIYLSPWDRNHPEYGKSEYITYFRNQLCELLTNYGDLFEVWFDGANGGTGYYGGANENRNVDRKTYYDWNNTYALVRQLQPNAMLFSDAGPDCRWCGNEEGWVGETNWSLLRRDEVWPGYPNYTELRYGHENGTHWVPAEVNVSIRPGWFYHESEDHKVKSLQQMVDIYYSSVGRNGTFLLNLPVDKRGLVHETDVKRLQEMATILKADFADNLAKNASVTATNVRGKANKFSPDNLTDADNMSYWATDDSVKVASFIVDLGKPMDFNRILLQEYIRLGQRVKKFSVEAYMDGEWKLLEEQTTIGYKRILRLPTTHSDKLRINIVEAKACPVISNIEVYNAPKMLTAPVVSRDKYGRVTLSASDKELEIKYSLDGSEPSLTYTEPIQTTSKVVVKACAVEPKNGRTSDVTVQSFDVIKKDWKVRGIKDANTDCLFDGNDSTVWHQSQKDMPIALEVDMGSIHTLRGFTYLPDQGRWPSGIIFNYLLSVSEDGKDWKEVSKGEFSNIRNNPIRRTIEFQPVKARYWKFTALSTTDGNTVAGYAEIDVLTQ